MTFIGTPHIKIIISNCSSAIPYSVLEFQLKSAGQKIPSMHYLKVEIQDQAFSHILSFRLQVFKAPNEYNLAFFYIEIKFQIILVADNKRCKICYKHGHTREQC